MAETERSFGTILEVEGFLMLDIATVGLLLELACFLALLDCATFVPFAFSLFRITLLPDGELELEDVFDDNAEGDETD